MADDSNHDRQPPCVLVTGGSGFVASHLILQLLAAGFVIRTTVRAPTRERDVRDAIQRKGEYDMNRLSFFVADLMKDDGWAAAMFQCSFVLHVASPFPGTAPKNEDDLILPARDGTLRVLRMARDANVQRVVITSSFAAIGYGHERLPLFTEENWSVLDGKIQVPTYHKSKTLAEKAAWKFWREESGNLEMAVINPTGIFGPVMSPDFSSSIQIIRNMLNGNMPGCPQISFGVVDVRDLADLHIRAMTSPKANGQRFIGTCDDGPFAMIDIANILRTSRPTYAQNVPRKELPNLLVRVAAIFRPAFRGVVAELGVVKKIDNSRAKSVLGWVPRSVEDCVLDTADSLIEHNLV